MTAILCVTPNVALDRTLMVAGFHADGVWRADDVAVTAGGKGLNVARALARLGQPTHVAGFLGGRTGDRIAALAGASEVSAHWTRISGENRTCIIVADGRGGSTVINEPGPMIDAEDWDRFVGDVARLAFDAGIVAISGSLPPGAPAAAIRNLIKAAGPLPVWVDTSGAALAEAVAAQVHGIKVNAGEVGSVLGSAVTCAADALIAAGALRQEGVRRVAITLGAEGAVLLDDEGAWQATAPPVSVSNAVGGGDCFLAGLLAASVQGEGPEAALRLAMACGSANAATLAVGDIDPAFVSALLPEIAVRQLERPSV